MWMTLLSNWKLIAGAIAITVLLGFVWAFIARGEKIDTLNKQVGTLTEQLDRSVEIANANAAQAKAVQAKADRDAAIMADVTKQADDRVAAARKREKEILNVSKDKDGAVAPVLRDTLIRLRLQRSAD